MNIEKQWAITSIITGLGAIISYTLIAVCSVAGCDQSRSVPCAGKIGSHL